VDPWHTRCFPATAMGATFHSSVLILGVILVCAFGALADAPIAEGTTIRHVNRTDTSCGGRSPCYGSIQAAVNAAQAGDTIQIQPGAYVEQVSISGKNQSAKTEASRIVIQADPSASVGSVVLHGPVQQCAQGHAIRIQQSRFVTIRGLTITGAGGAGVALGEASRLLLIAPRYRVGAALLVASVCGTEGDPQRYSRQVALLEEAGIVAAPSNAHAAELAVDVLRALA